VTRFHRNVNIAAVVLPFVAVLAAIPMLWNELIGWSDVLLFAVMYFFSTMGITVGYHRLLTHRAFATYKPIEYLFAAFGSMAVEGPVIGWVSDHRRHHAHADDDGDPHSPHGHGGPLRGLWHAHLG
jgi:stearoyl-CoA desaturase (Delta-9 desaturase)